MSISPTTKVGLISCSGEELSVGFLSRLATLKVLEELRPKNTVTICLPLFLAGDEKERGFARVFPTITVDGCEKRCAYRATSMYSAPPAKSIVVSDILKQNNLSAPLSLRKLAPNEEETKLIISNIIVSEIDSLTIPKNNLEQSTIIQQISGVEEKSNQTQTSSCSCTISLPVSSLIINGKSIEVKALPLILEIFHEAQKPVNVDTGHEILDKVKIYNEIDIHDENLWIEALLDKYKALL